MIPIADSQGLQVFHRPGNVSDLLFTGILLTAALHQLQVIDDDHSQFGIFLLGLTCNLTDVVGTDSGLVIDQDADLILFIYRDEIYNSETEDKNIAEINLAKHRNGEIGGCRLAFIGQYTKFANLALGSDPTMP